MDIKDRGRVIIENLTPEIEEGRFPIKRVPGENIIVQADIFTDGHDLITAILRYRSNDETSWHETPMSLLANDRWEGRFQVRETGTYYYTLQAWLDHFRTWQMDLLKKIKAVQDVQIDLLIGLDFLKDVARRAINEDVIQVQKLIVKLEKGINQYKQGFKSDLDLFWDEEVAQFITKYNLREMKTEYPRELAIYVERPKALFSSWYEIFPRSLKGEENNGLKACEKLIPEIAEMGFDVLYLPPIHPIGRTARKGKNNNPETEPHEPGSPWAIGAKEGGHKAIHPELGTIQDFEQLVETAKKQGIEIALDIAFQCSPDHPYVKEHPSWFKWRPDGTVQFAENPPKKYQDIIPFYFETPDWQALWEELKSIFEFWIEKGISIFRVDNPHTKPFSFWQWVIREIKLKYPDVLFLAEAFSRPKVMKRLAKLGFSQSYTYFTWRNTKHELVEYMRELTRTELVDYFRPNFWPNTPDILPEYLQYGGRPAFIIRLVLAATLSSNYGIYGPAFELGVSKALQGKEEYLDSEKYEIKTWDRNKPGYIKDMIKIVNTIRRENPALHTFRNINFYPVNNDRILFYERATEEKDEVLLIAVNLDPYHTQAGWVKLPLNELGLAPGQLFLLQDLISEDKYLWQGEDNYVELNPHILPVHIFKLNKLVRRENSFDYFM